MSLWVIHAANWLVSSGGADTSDMGAHSDAAFAYSRPFHHSLFC